MFLTGSPDYTNPSDPAMDYVQQIPETVKPYYDPYIALGRGAARTMAPVYQQMITDPQGYYSGIMGGYEESPNYQYQQAVMNQSMQGDAASGGYTGTEYDQARQAAATQALLSRDQEQYYRDVTGAQQQGLAGGQRFFDTGYRASDTLANILAKNLGAQAGLAYKGAAWDNQMEAQHRKNMNEAIGSGVGSFLYYV